MRRAPLLALALGAAACATAAKKPADAVRQAEHGLPAATEFAEGPERAAYAAAHAHEARGDAASGEAARAEWAQAGQGYAALAEKPAAAVWRVPLLHRAAELLLRAQRWERAGEVAGQLVAEARANDTSKAIGARLAASAALSGAGAQVKAGQLDKLDLALAGPKKQKPVPAAWRRVVESADAYAARAAADPDPGRSAAERRSGASPAELALAAAEVHYAHGDLDGARTRFEAVMDRWPSDAEVLEQAIPLFLATFHGRGDRDGHDAAVERLRERVQKDAAKASAPKEKEAFAKVLDFLARARAGARFGAAERLLQQGKPAEAARAFEAVAAEPGVGEPANALHNAAIAWDRAGDAGKAAKVREKILKDHPTSPVAQEDALALAVHRSRAGDHAASGRLYEEFLGRWPDSPSRCLALRNAASELDVAGRPAEAAWRYLAFAREPACAKAAPDVAGRALLRAGRLFESQARAAYGEAAALPGMSEAEAKGIVAEAKKRLKGLQ